MGDQHGADTPGGAPVEKLALGVLFVHGMGSAAQGDTLRQHSEPLVDWLAHGTVRFESASLRDVEMMPGDGEPAHLTCELFAKDPPGAIVPAGERKPASTWLLAESHWAQTFKPVTYLRIATWLIASVPWMLGEYARSARRRERKRRAFPGRGLLVWMYAALATVVAGPIIIVLALLVPLQYAPMKRLRDWGGALPRMLAATLGDVYVILATHVDREAMRARIVRDHEWLQARCERTVVVAHSAGSALTHQLIRDGRMTDVEVFVTLGEAIWRMCWMRQLTELPARKRIGALALALLGFVLWVTAVYLGLHYHELWIVFVGWIPSVAVHWWSAALVWRGCDTHDIRRSAVDVLLGEPAKVSLWRDYVASSDPVPGGVLYDDEDDTEPGARERYQPQWIRNARSVVLDHVRYPGNLEEYVSGLAADLAAADRRLPQGALIAPGKAASAHIARALRTLSLTMARLGSTLLGLALLIVLYWGGQRGLARLGEHADWASDALVDAVAMLPGDLEIVPRLAGKLTGAGVVLLLLAASWPAIYVAWKAWDRRDRARFMSPEPVGAPNPVPIGEFTTREVRPRQVDRRFAVWWLAWSLGASAIVLALADQPARAPLPLLAGVGGALLILFVRRIARWRDNAYGRSTGAMARAS